MSITSVSAAEDVCLPGIGKLADDLAAALDTGGAVRLDLSAVVGPDLSVVQLVQSARITAARRGCDFALAAPVAGPMRALLDRAGFTTALSAEDRQFWFHGETAQ
jgi:hypothetical protein